MECERGSAVRPWVAFRSLPSAKIWSADDILDHLDILESEGRVQLKKLKGNMGVADCVVSLTGVGRKSLEVHDEATLLAHKLEIKTTTSNIRASQVGNRVEISGFGRKHGHDESQATGQSAVPEPHHPKAFVSHATQDHPFVDKFATDLRAHGIDTWFSKWEIKPGDSIRTKIEEGLEGCEYFVIILSRNSIGRPWVQTELDAATIRKLNGKVRKIIPVKIENCGDLPPTLASLCWEDFSNQPYEAAFKRVKDSIFEIDSRPPLRKPVSQTTLDQSATSVVPEVSAKPNRKLEISNIRSVLVQPGIGSTAMLISVKNTEGRFENICHNVRAELIFSQPHTGDELKVSALFVTTDGQSMAADPRGVVSIEMLQAAHFAILVRSDTAHRGFFTFRHWPFDPVTEKRLPFGEWLLRISVNSDAGKYQTNANYLVQLNPDLSSAWSSRKP